MLHLHCIRQLSKFCPGLWVVRPLSHYVINQLAVAGSVFEWIAAKKRNDLILQLSMIRSS